MIGLNKNTEVAPFSWLVPAGPTIGKSILKALAYFDVFRYPLTAEEIRLFLDQSCNEIDVTTALQDLVKAQKIFHLNEFYSLQNDLSLSERRIKGNERAGSLLKIAGRIASTIYKFPYVRAIGVSGSVSKNFADEQADIDYFIITKSNRLWIARTLLHIFKKNPFLKNRNRHYCMNYFVDEADLVIEEKNIYTATELFTLIPMAGNGSMKKFFEANCWSFVYFPNLSLPEIKKENNPLPWYKKLMELFFNNRLGDWLENYFFRLTTKRWKKKEEEKRLNTKGERMGLKTGKHVSKPNPIFFHDWFVSKYETRLNEVMND
jgi:hypothetical protein